jgi:hypothetical protein
MLNLFLMRAVCSGGKGKALIQIKVRDDFAGHIHAHENHSFYLASTQVGERPDRPLLCGAAQQRLREKIRDRRKCA